MSDKKKTSLSYRASTPLSGLGVRELSMAPNSLPRVKRRIRHLEMTAATEPARAVMSQSDDGRIAALIDDFSQLQA